MIPHTIFHYRILGKLGEGGMGEVYQALDTKLDRKVALKILHGDSASDRKRTQRFLQEARAAAALSHPNVCVILEVGEIEDGRPFIAMEYVQGQTLDSKIGGYPVDVPEILDIGIQIADALDEAHTKGITHRDIKPANIMITPRGQVKVLDFGLAKMTADPSQDIARDLPTVARTEPGLVMGTVAYMSPEQALGRNVSSRTDIFSLGVVLYEMATGRRPFSGISATETIDQILHSEPEAIPRFNSNVPAELERIVLKCMEKDLERRYQSAGELVADLRSLKRDADLSMGSERGAPRVPAQFPQRAGWHRWAAMARSRPWTLGLSALALACAVIAVFWTLASHASVSFAARDWILITDFDNQTGDSLFDKSLSTALTVSLEQSTYANVFPRARIGNALQRMGKNKEEKIVEELGREICQRENIRGLISPVISRVGQQYTVSARLIHPETGDTIRSYMERAQDQEHILRALDAIASRIRRDLGESLASIRGHNRELPKVTTSSLQALKLYAEANVLWNKGQHHDAVGLYQSTLQYDPDFAKAHADLGDAYYSFVFNNPIKGKEHFEKALKLSERTTERERMTIEIDYKASLGHYDDAVQLYDVYLKTYPDDLGIRFNFGTFLMMNNQYEEAILQLKEVLRIDPKYANAHINTATSYTALGKHTDALAYYAKAFDLEPSWMTQGNLNHEYGFALVGAGDKTRAREVFNKASSKPRRLRSLALLDLYQGRHREAKERLREAILLNESFEAMLSKARDHIYMSIVHEGEGNRAARLLELDKSAQSLKGLAPQVWLSARIGRGYARGASVEKAVKTLDTVRKQVDPKNSGQSSDLHWLEGEVALARGDQDRAINLLDLSNREHHTPLTVESLAHVYTMAGKGDQAIAAYENLIGMKGHSLGWEPQQLWITAHYHLAKAYRSQGQKEKATKLIDVFLDLWKEADANLPLLKEARRLREELRN